MDFGNEIRPITQDACRATDDEEAETIVRACVYACAWEYGVLASMCSWLMYPVYNREVVSSTGNTELIHGTALNSIWARVVAACVHTACMRVACNILQFHRVGVNDGICSVGVSTKCC